MTPNVLSIAGSDPSGGAGVQADLKTFAALRCYGMAAVTALTAQNTTGVFGVHAPSADFVAAQIDAVFADISVAAVKIGMLGSGAVAAAVADRLRAHRPPFVVLDPVLAATSGDPLGSADVVDVIVRELAPLVDLVTPNAPEAARLADVAEPRDVAAQRAAAAALVARGARAVLVKGGHLDGDVAVDVLLAAGVMREYSAPRVATGSTHGTGCTLSSAIAAFVAHGLPLDEAVGRAKDYLTGALRGGDALAVGRGHGPVDHFWDLWKS
jgi:hydroxymethylpyrimidine/phosphomethylpyrimidine kinase